MTEEETINRALAILKQRLHQPDHYFTQPDDATNYLKLLFLGLEYESFRALFLDSQHGLIREEEMFRGSIDGASVYPREVVKAALSFNAAAVIFAHNHPSGICEPSQADKQITKRLKEALGLLDIRVLDHIVVGGKHSYSFAEHYLI